MNCYCFVSNPHNWFDYLHQKYLDPFGDTMGEKHLPALSNVAPYHLVTQSSVDFLNENIPNLVESVNALNFRCIFNGKRLCRHFSFSDPTLW